MERVLITFLPLYLQRITWLKSICLYPVWFIRSGNLLQKGSSTQTCNCLQIIWIHRIWICSWKTDEFYRNENIVMYRKVGFVLFACECPVSDAIWYIQLLGVKSIWRWNIQWLNPLLLLTRWSVFDLCSHVANRTQYFLTPTDRQVLMLH